MNDDSIQESATGPGADSVAGSGDAPREISPEETRAVLLVVEDDPFLGGMLERKLHDQKFTVFRAETVEEGRALLAEKPINLVCLDLILPGEDGFVLLREIKANEKMKHIPVLILSNLGQRDDLEKARQIGAADYAVKANTSPNEIVAKIEQLLGIT
ncbi:MAG: response regulator [bacterium]|nr:response regulator [bacterium]MDZ4284802.1 response regulator [Patescibacteria group bacterium]